MFLEVLAAIRTLSKLGTPAKILSDIISESKGDTRSLLEEIKHNLQICKLVVEDRVSIDDVIKEIKTDAYDQILRTRYNFNNIQRKKIAISATSEMNSLRRWNGKSTSDLIETIYDRLKEIRLSYPHNANNPGKRWKVRFRNVYLRLLFLIKHSKS